MVNPRLEVFNYGFMVVPLSDHIRVKLNPADCTHMQLFLFLCPFP